MAFAAPATALEQKSRKARWYDAYPSVQLAVQLLQLAPQSVGVSIAVNDSLRQRRQSDGMHHHFGAWAQYLATLQYQPEACRVRLAHQWAQQVLTNL